MAEKKNYSLEETRDQLIDYAKNGGVWPQEFEEWEYMVNKYYEKGDLSKYVSLATASECIKNGDFVGLNKTYTEYTKSLPDDMKLDMTHLYLLALTQYVPYDDAVKFAMAQPDLSDIELSCFNDQLTKKNPQYRAGVTKEQYRQSLGNEPKVAVDEGPARG